MQQVFIELYNYRPSWAKCPESERTDFAKKVVEAVKGLTSAGVDVVAYGMNSPETDRRAPYDFFCVYRAPNVELQREFERRSPRRVGTITSSRCMSAVMRKTLKPCCSVMPGWLDR